MNLSLYPTLPLQNLCRAKTGFTLVELIVVITILAILGTIGFISLRGYASTARDTSRTSDISNISKGLEVLLTKGSSIPQPDANLITITASGATIGYQGYAGPKTLSIIGIGGKSQDPLDNQYYTYSTNLAQSKYQILGLLEDSGNPSLALGTIPGIDTAYAAYDTRYPLTKGANLGILLWTGAVLNQPIQESSSATIDITNTTNTYSAYFANKDIISGSGATLWTPIQISFNNGGSGFGVPRNCPTGFIPVPGNKDFSQPGFCVSKYAMTYADADIPNSCYGTCPGWVDNTSGPTYWTDWNTVAYVGGKLPVSLPNKFPITNITQSQAVIACQTLGTGYHLITNNEWMTIARDIEATGDNWSTWIVGSGWIYRGITGEVNSVSSLGCETSSSLWVGSRSYVAKPLSFDTTKFGTAKGVDCDSKRQFKLSNSQIIWDLSGNIWQNVNKGNTVSGNLYNDVNTWKSDACNSVNGYAAFSNGLVADGVPTCAYSNGYSYANIGPKTANLNSNNGIGRIYSYANAASNVFMRGGDAGGGVNRGIFALYLGWAAGDLGRNSGFRCAR